MTAADFDRLLSTLGKAWSDRRYADAASLFAKNVFYSDAVNYTFTDRNALLRFFQSDEGFDQSCTFHNAVFDDARQIGVAEYTYIGTHRYDGTVWIAIEGVEIVGWREYQYVSERASEGIWRRIRS